MWGVLTALRSERGWQEANTNSEPLLPLRHICKVLFQLYLRILTTSMGSDSHVRALSSRGEGLSLGVPHHH